ncbi:ABC-2 transporter permease [Clostridium sp. Marseille-Q2269]|uniref:ABC-2 transporter permease n=1 Tax=Clostridium sp. Marseille-Q2269 TaxID=2942205 RepID=UPI00207443BF|nr:ABC-2 transporter permease [Clostridium sp. Marseille-Q2269]
MLNLIKKDLMITKSYMMKVLAGIIFSIFIFYNIDKQNMFVYCMYVSVYIIITTSFTYGEISKEDYILNSLPIKKNQVVWAKYISVILYFAFTLIVIYIIAFIAYILNFRNIIGFPTIKTVIYSLIVILVSTGLQLPIYFKFGYNRGRIIAMIIYFSIFAVIYKNSEYNMVNSNIVYETLGILSIILFVISIFLSMKIYSSKEII